MENSNIAVASAANDPEGIWLSTWYINVLAEPLGITPSNPEKSGLGITIPSIVNFALSYQAPEPMTLCARPLLPSWPGLSRPSVAALVLVRMAGTGPAMTVKERQ
jgi:hypothetical protein